MFLLCSNKYLILTEKRAVVFVVRGAGRFSNSLIRISMYISRTPKYLKKSLPLGIVFELLNL
jgi:hypothetical protein